MKKLVFAILLFISSSTSAQTFHIDGDCDVYYSPNGGATKAIVKIINSAKTSIYVLAYSFTSHPISDALIAAHKREVYVEIILDKGQPNAKGGLIHDVYAAGIPTYVDYKHAIAHNKIMIVDGSIFENGSFNYTTGAEHKNGENALICPSVQGAKLYKDNWDLHLSHSKKFEE